MIGHRGCAYRCVGLAFFKNTILIALCCPSKILPKRCFQFHTLVTVNGIAFYCHKDSYQGVSGPVTKIKHAMGLLYWPSNIS